MYCQRNKVNGYGYASLFKYKLTVFSHVVQERARGFCPLPFPSAGDRWFRAYGTKLAKLE